jgi:hypothetical protein
MFGKKVDGTGCNDTVPRTYEPGGKPAPRTHDTFGRGECREVNQSIQAQKDMAMLGGMVLGKCSTSNGNEYQEGSCIQLGR